MGQYGESTVTNSFEYSTNGLPLVTNLIELTTSITTAPGERHQGFPAGIVVISAWPGQPTNPATQYSGVHWMLPSQWYPYQKANFVTPAFPGYISGHSTFSRSAAEVLAAITGSPFFPGGMGTFTAPSNTFLSFEQGPSQTVQLQWGTYFDASDEAGISRLYGGIHVSVDDLTGRIIGSQCGQAVYALAQQYFDGSVSNTPFSLTMKPLNQSQSELRWPTLRGFFYKLQSTTNLSDPFSDEPAGFVQALDSSSAQTNSITSENKFYRVIRSSGP
jgi:hypothetical protein